MFTNAHVSFDEKPENREFRTIMNEVLTPKSRQLPTFDRTARS
jgi:hypothetical protein